MPVPAPGGSLPLTARDTAKIGLLYLNNGWQGEARIVPESRVRGNRRFVYRQVQGFILNFQGTRRFPQEMDMEQKPTACLALSLLGPGGAAGVGKRGLILEAPVPDGAPSPMQSCRTSPLKRVETETQKRAERTKRRFS